MFGASEAVHVSRDNKSVFVPLIGSLGSVGMASFFGGSSTFAGVSAITVAVGLRWVGWYNSPGAPALAELFLQLTSPNIASSLFRHGQRDPTLLFDLNGQTGPRFVAAHSGVVLDFTGHPGALLARKAEATSFSQAFKWEGTYGKQGTGQNVTIINLQWNNLNQSPVKMPVSFEPPSLTAAERLRSLVPMSVSVVACLLCALLADWFCFASIMVGMVAHGAVCAVVGSRKLTFTAPEAASGAPPGDGVLVDKRETVILIGAGSAVNVFTRGRFFLKFGKDKEGNAPAPAQPEGRREADGSDNAKGGDAAIRGAHNSDHSGCPSLSSKLSMPGSMPACPSPASCSIPSALLTYLAGMAPTWQESMILFIVFLLLTQPVIQFFLVAQGTSFGQSMFAATILVSWVYNVMLSRNIDHDGTLNQFLFDKLSVDESRHVQKYHLTTVTSLVAFTAFVLASARPKFDAPLAFLDAMIQPNTAAWKAWKEAMATLLKDRDFIINRGKADQRVFSEADLKRVDAEYRKLLKIFFDDAEDAWKAWCEVRDDQKMKDLREITWAMAK